RRGLCERYRPAVECSHRSPAEGLPRIGTIESVVDRPQWCRHDERITRGDIPSELAEGRRFSRGIETSCLELAHRGNRERRIVQVREMGVLYVRDRIEKI